MMTVADSAAGSVSCLLRVDTYVALLCFDAHTVYYVCWCGSYFLVMFDVRFYASKCIHDLLIEMQLQQMLQRLRCHSCETWHVLTVSYLTTYLLSPVVKV